MTRANSVTPLPVDPDVDVEQMPNGSLRPVHVRMTALAVVFAGGTVGAGVREALTLVFPPVSGTIPWTVFTINLVGAFLLGILLDALARRGADHGRRRTLRLLLGTGVMGGFTTYSAFATDTALLFMHGAIGLGVAYGIGTVLFGGLATWAGIALATYAHNARTGVAS